MKKTTLLTTLVGCGLLLGANLSNAADLWQVYRQAKQSDPTYQKAQATWLAAKETLPQSVAALLPAIVAVGDYTTTSNTLKQGGGVNSRTGRFGYDFRSFMLSISQPLIDFSKYEALRSAHANVKAAAANFAGAQQALITRIATAYFNVLFAQDALTFTRAEYRSTFRQLTQARQRFKVGLVAVTNVYQARARNDAVKAELITAENALANAKEALQQITGKPYSTLAPLKRRLPLTRPSPSAIQPWVDSASQHNLNLMAAHFLMDASRSGISIAHAGHYPTLNLIATATHALTDPHPLTFASDSINENIHLEARLPLFNGGFISSKTRQAEQVYRQRVADWRAAYRGAIATTRMFYNNIVSGLSKIKADQQAIRSSKASLKSTQAAYRVGTNTIIDVLEQQQELYSSQRQYAQDQYQFINDSLALKQAAGNLCEQDLKNINGWLKAETRSSSLQKK